MVTCTRFAELLVIKVNKCRVHGQKNSIRMTRAHLLMVDRVGPVVAQRTRTLLGEVTAEASKMRFSGS
jgi:hypothetical protein